MQQAIRDLFVQYEFLTNTALTGKPDLIAIAALYDEAFIGSSPNGVMVGKNNDDFARALADGIEFYRELGATQMIIKDLRPEQLDPLHSMVKVDWRATFAKSDDRHTVEFTNIYLTRVTEGLPKVIGWITEDEIAVLRKHGLVSASTASPIST